MPKKGEYSPSAMLCELADIQHLKLTTPSSGDTSDVADLQALISPVATSTADRRGIFALGIVAETPQRRGLWGTGSGRATDRKLLPATMSPIAPDCGVAAESPTASEASRNAQKENKNIYTAFLFFTTRVALKKV